MTAPSYADQPPKLIAGAPGVDFLNTVEWRGDPDRFAERLTSYHELVLWCRGAGVLSGPEASSAEAEAERHPQAARRVLAAAVELRDATVATVTAPARRAAALARLNAHLGEARFTLSIAATAEGGFRTVTSASDDALRLPLGRLAGEIVTALSGEEARRIRSCTNKRCGWFYLDTSRNGTRRWCQMATCGNQAKARAHYARRRDGTS